MDTTTRAALQIISNPSISDWRKRYWIQRVKDEIAGYRLVKLETQASWLEKQLNAVISNKV